MFLQRSWQRKWRKAFGESTDLMPEIRDDYALQFDIWNIGWEKLEECFSIFPNGRRMLDRVERVINIRFGINEIDDEGLLKKLEEFNESIETVLIAYGYKTISKLEQEK